MHKMSDRKVYILCALGIKMVKKFFSAGVIRGSFLSEAVIKLCMYVLVWVPPEVASIHIRSQMHVIYLGGRGNTSTEV